MGIFAPEVMMTLEEGEKLVDGIRIELAGLGNLT